MPKILKGLRFHQPNLAKNIGSPAWCAQALILTALIGSSVALGVARFGETAPEPENIAAVVPARVPSLSPAEKTIDSVTLARNLPGFEDRIDQSGPSFYDSLPELPPIEALASEDVIEALTDDWIRTAKVKRGDTLLDALVRAGANPNEANGVVVAMAQHFNMRKLRAGQALELRFDPQDTSRLMLVRMKPDVETAIVAQRNAEDGFDGAVKTIQLTPVTARAEGRISDSLYMAMDRAGVPHDIIVNQINIFSWDIDFQREIHPGDTFEVFFERYVDDDGEPMKNGDILYASMTVQGKRLDLYRFTPSDDGRADYFDPSGQSVRKALLKTPIDGARLTSGFGKRHHPVLGYTKMHKGSDFGARTGTPVKAAGDGVIERASRFGSYGNYVRIKHNGTYQTAYAHLNGFAKGIKKGVKVKQGQIIGYVGTTGRSTGPHLHYEVLKDDKHVNPMGLKLPTGRKLDGDQLMAFQTMIKDRTVEIASVPVTMQVATGE